MRQHPQFLGERIAVLSAVAVSLSLGGCGGSAASKVPSGPMVLKGAGATAPYLAYSKWFEAYKSEEPGVLVHYQATGSGEASGSWRPVRSISRPQTSL